MEGDMATPRKSIEDDNALRLFYEACGLSHATIERAIKCRYEEPRIENRDRAIAEPAATPRRTPPKKWRAK